MPLDAPQPHIEAAPPREKQRDTRAARPERRRENPRPERAAGEKPVRQERENRPVRERRPGQNRDSRAEPIGVGFADKVPAFMRKPVRAVKVAVE
jgi:hypothetical protein